MEFARSLHSANLIDELRLAVLPVALGSGEGLFAGLPNKLDLTLVDSLRFRGEAMANTYRPVR